MSNVQAIADALPSLEKLRRKIRAVSGAQVQAVSLLADVHSFATHYFNEVRPVLISASASENHISEVDDLFTQVLASSRTKVSKGKILKLLDQSKRHLIALEGATAGRMVQKPTGARTSTDNLIIESLQEICPGAANSYDQALADLVSKDRLSYRGPATDLREALRETLDVLAPDSEVEATVGYKPEPDAKRPTMKQKVRYILRSRGIAANQLAVPEGAVVGIEEIIGNVVRSVYTRSNVSTHTVTDRSEVLRVHAWVRMVFCELLAIPL
jgi:hypothetical protein